MVTPLPASRRSGVSSVLLAGVLVVAGFMAIECAPGNNAPVAVSSASPSTSPSPNLASFPTPITVAAANALIRATVTGANPLALPSTIPANWSAVVTNLSSSVFTVTYTSPDRTKEVDFAIVVPNPPPPGPNGSQVHPRFHGDTNSLYQVDDTSVATSHRWLIWNEPGTWAESNALPGVPYFFAANGLTDSEFWAIVNSLK